MVPPLIILSGILGKLSTAYTRLLNNGPKEVNWFKVFWAKPAGPPLKGLKYAALIGNNPGWDQALTRLPQAPPTVWVPVAVSPIPFI